MYYYLVLTLATLAVAALTFLLWWKSRSIAFPLGMAFVYYPSLFGAWYLVYDKSGGDSERHYSYLEDKMFPVNLDDLYMLSLIVYSLFAITIAITALVLIRSGRQSQTQAFDALAISHTPIVIVCAFAAVGSYLIVRGGLATASELHISAYAFMKRGFGEVSDLFTIHQILYRIALIPATIGLAIILSGRSPILLKGRTSVLATICYVSIITTMTGLAVILGYKSELFYSGLVGCLFYLANTRRPRWLLAGAVGICIVIGMSLVDRLRGVSLDGLSGALQSEASFNPKVAVDFLASSNEAFAPHFSLYGVLIREVPVTYGYSFLSLAASVVPRIFWPGRPPDIYTYYAESISAAPGQGYTIHHATAWYLNFGIPGVVLGAIVFALAWSKLFNLYLNDPYRHSKIVRIFSSVAPWTFTAYIPFLMRSGPEIYKGLAVEALLLPTLVLTLGSFSWRFSARRRADP